MTERKKPGRQPGVQKVKVCVSLSPEIHAAIKAEADKRKKPMTVPGYIAAAFENKFGEKP